MKLLNIPADTVWLSMIEPELKTLESTNTGNIASLGHADDVRLELSSIVTQQNVPFMQPHLHKGQKTPAAFYLIHGRLVGVVLTKDNP